MKIQSSVFRKSISLVLAAVTASGLLAGAAYAGDGTEAQGERTVNIGIQPSAAFIPIFIAKEKGWLEEDLGEIGVTVNWNEFEAGPPMNESMASGSTDFGFLGDVPAVSAIAAGQDNVLVGIAAEAPEAYVLLASADNDEISSVADLKGKTVGITVGSTAQNVLEKLLEKNDLKSSDVQVVNISAGDAATALTEKQTDAVLFWEPTPTRLIDQGLAKAVADAGDADQLCVNPITARREYVEANPDITQILLQDYQKRIDEVDSLDDETKEKIADYLSVDADQYDTIASHYDYTLKIQDQDADALQDVLQFLIDAGNVKNSYEVKDKFDASYLDAAGLS